MKKLILFFIFGCMLNTAAVAITYNSQGQGKMSNEISNSGSITELIIIGDIDASDFNVMRDMMSSLQVLDMTDANICVLYDNPANEIPPSALASKTSLKKIILPNNLVSIGASAFQGCTNITEEFTLPDSLKTIGNSAFEGCIRLRLSDAPLPDSLVSIGNRAFYNCADLGGTRALPASLITIGTSAFYNCINLAGLDFSEATVLTSIGAGAFEGCTKLKASLDFPASLITIGDKAFENCRVTEITFPANAVLNSIGANAFYYCYNLVGTLSFPASLTTIGASAFYNCNQLAGLDFSEATALTSIGARAFQDCKKLAGDIAFPANLTSIGDRAFFDCDKLSGISFASGSVLESIGAGAFFGCSGLTGTLTLYSALTSIGDSAFFNCANLEGTIAFPASLETIGNSAFFGCSSLTKITFAVDGALTSIGNSAFEGCNSVSAYPDALAFPANLKTIGNSAFKDCWALQGEVVFPAKLETIGDFAFKDCGVLFTITFAPNGALTSIGNSAFEGCASLSLSATLAFPASLKTIGDYAFKDCWSISAITFAPSATLTTIGESAFYNCSFVSSEVAFPASLETIGDRAFNYCSSLKKITFVADGALTSIGNSAFSQCTTLTDTIAFPASLETIGNNAFYRCRVIKKITFPADGALTKIGDSAFEQCTTLTDTIAFPVGLTTIGASAFNSCDSLRKITFPQDGALITIGNSAFSGCRNLNHALAFPANLESIGASAFSNTKLVQTLAFPAKLKSIGERAFENCVGLSGLSFPVSLETIGTSAFSSCVNVSKITFASGGALAIGNSAFYNLSTLSKLELPDGLVSIGTSAFINCGALDTLILPASLTTIGNQAFGGCTKLSLVINFNPTPVAITDPTFLNAAFRDTCILRLPTKEAYSRYKDSLVWKDFKFEEYEDGLDTIILSEGTLDPVFEKHNAVYVYDVKVANRVDSIIIKVFPLDANATISDTLINKRLEVGTDSVKFTVTAQAGNTQEYKIIITRRSRDSTLRSISLPEQGSYPAGDTLFPRFHPDSTYYRLSVGYLVDTIGIVGTVNHPKATVDGHGEKIPLDVGTKTVTITVTAEDGNTLDYIVEVTRRSNNANLASIIVSSKAGQESFQPTFANEIYEYTALVVNDVDSVFIYAPAEHPKAVVTGAGAHRNLALGSDTISITVTAEDGNYSQVYKVIITRLPSDDASLVSLTADGSMIPDFEPDKNSYVLYVEKAKETIEFGAVANHPKATVSGDTGVHSLNVGYNLFTINVQAEDNSATEYKIEVVRPSVSIPIPVPGNYKLEVSHGRLVPEDLVAGEMSKEYTLVLPNLIDKISVSVVPDFPPDSVQFSIMETRTQVKEANISMPMSINADSILLKVHITLDGEEAVCFITIYGHPSPTSNALLENLYLSEGELIMLSGDAQYNNRPGFMPSLGSYKATVPNDVDSITIFTQKGFDTDTVRIGKTLPESVLADSAKFGLNVGSNSFIVRVNTTGTATKNYSVIVTREQSSDAALSNLIVDKGALSPVFATDTLNYRDTVAFAEDSITLTATPRHAQATVTGGNVQRRRLVVGTNNLSITVKAENGVGTQIYNVSVYRRSNDSSLQKITVSDGSLTPVFSKTTRYYTDSVANNVESITLGAQASHVNAVVTGDIGTHSLSNVGSNEFHITVTSEDGGQNSTYTINVYRRSNDAGLRELTVSEGTLSPVFDIYTLSYRNTVANNVTDITLSATVNHPGARIVSGIGTKGLNVGDNKFDIVVSAEDGTQKTYSVIVRRRSNDAKLGNLRILNTTSSSEVLDFQPVFNSETFEYHVHLRSYVERIRLDATARNEAATISGAGSKTLANNVFSFSYSIVVTSEDGIVTQTYVVNVSKDNPADATLKSLTSDNGVLVPAFHPDSTTYTLTSIPDIDQLRFSAETTNDYAEGVSGIGTQIVQVGANVFVITVTAEDGETTKTYTVNVVRPDLSLRSLTLGEGLLEPKYNEATRTYSADVLSNVIDIDIKALPTDTTAKVSGNGKEQLKKGSNSFTLTVISADGFAVREYTLTVFRDDRGSDALLKSLSVNVGRFTPQFRDSAFVYFLRSSVANDVSLVTITAETRDPNATIESNLVDVPLEIGGNEIQILVRAANKIDVQVYTLMIERLPKEGEPTPPFDSLARLRDLRISTDAGELVPRFNPDIPDYTLPVNCTTDSLMVTAEAHDSCTVMYIINEQEVQMPMVLEPGYTLLYIYIVRSSKYIARYSISVSRSLNMATIIPYWHDVLAVNLNPETNGGYEFTSFQWVRNGTPVAGETGSYWYNNGKTFSSGEYSIQVTTTDGKSLTTCPLTLVSGEVADISAYPNPTQSHVTVVTSESSTRHRIEIIDLKGNVQKSYPSSGKETSIDITGIPAGVYVVRVGQKTTKIVIAAED